ncbi:hypothetical protein OU426_04610 [Frigidibacter sp. RF13]|uniref:hypothetical protein n=1 Tax=Frigidibacter sp. RF13 TaxID=2997340 RepID=UPI00226DDBE0|nr:hypothetical protein [Frigidibacter sp. RF13]MCY1126128.1 hypothetical protein [Frigidibacter sp. RF13]
MGEATLAALERFLVEDVILTLGNLRGWIAWLADPATHLDRDMLSTFLERLDHQLELLQDRARAVCIGPQAPGSGVTLDGLLRDALNSDLPETAPAFRSRRAGLG